MTVVHLPRPKRRPSTRKFPVPVPPLKRDKLGAHAPPALSDDTKTKLVALAVTAAKNWSG